MSSAPFDYGSLFQNWAPPPSPTFGNPYDTYQTDWSQGDPSYAMKQNRGYMGAWGQTFDQQLNSQQFKAQQQGDMYGQAANLVGSGILNNPGFTPEEYAAITNPDGYQKGVTTPEQFASLAPTTGETSGMMGDPSSYMNYFQGTPAALAGNVQSGGKQTGDAITNAQVQAGQAMDSEGKTINDVFSRGGLSPSSDYYIAMSSAVDPSRLSLNLDPKYKMSDQEVRDMESQASSAVQNSEQARLESIGQRMKAAGTEDPLAFAAMSRESQGRTAEEAANSITSARIAAEDAQRQTEMNYAMANLGANQTGAGLRMQSAQEQAQTEIGAEQFKAAGQVGASENLAGQGVQQAQWAGGQGVQSSEDLAQMYQQALQYAASTGTSIQEAMDQVSTQRSSQQYGIRQGNTQYQQQQGYGQNFQTRAQLSQLYGQSAAARIAGQNTGLGWATQEQNQNQGMGLGLNQQRIGTAQTIFPQINQATGQWGTYQLGANASGFGQNFLQGLGSSLGRTLGSFGMQQNSDGSRSGSWGG